MGMNAQIHLYLKSELLEKLKKEAETERISVSQLCRNKIESCPVLTRIELMLGDLSKRLRYSNKSKLGGEKW